MRKAYKKNELKVFVSLLSIVFIFSNCKKLVYINPPVTSITSDNVFKSDAAASAVLTGLYTQLSAGSFATGTRSLSFLAGLSSDEMALWNGASNVSQNAYYSNGLSVTKGGFELWIELYPYIYTCNSAIEGLTNSSELTPSVKSQLLGEAMFLRAFFYFYLTNFYGNVPLVLTTDYKGNAKLPRNSTSEVYQQIIKDLNDAQEFLSSAYVKADAVSVSTERARPNKWTAISLLSRVYLYNGDFEKSEEKATLVINNRAIYDTVALNNVFLKNSKEAIWQLQPVNVSRNTEDAYLFIIPSTGLSSNTNPVYLSANLLNAFEINDQRKVNGNWIRKYTDPTNVYSYPFKYKLTNASGSATEYLMVLRLAEQYLIRAEARAQINKTLEAQVDLNTIRTRAGLPNTTATDKASLLAAISHERQVELFSEWGHRWLDLKRYGLVNTVMSVVASQKGGAWQATDQLYPIPLGEIQKNTNLVQNDGY